MTFKSNINVECGTSNATITYGYKYLNWVKGFSRVNTNGGPTTGSPLWYESAYINSDMYPVETTFGVTCSGALMAGTYVVRWLGSGQVTSASMGTKTDAPGTINGVVYGSGGASGIATNGRFKFTIANPNDNISIVVKGTTISNVVICLDNGTDENLIDSGKMFRTAYLDIIRAQNAVLRHSLGPCDINANFSCQWANRTPLSTLTYAGRIVGGKTSGAATGSANSYSVAAWSGAPASPTHGTIVQFYVPPAIAATGACTLTFGSWPSKTFVNGYNTAMTTSGNTLTGMVTAMYDGTTDKWIQCHADTTSWYGRWGIPWEVMLQESNESGLPSWISIPFFADDDYVDQLATLICTYPYQPATIYVEYQNEVWNTAGGFPLSQWAYAYGTAVLGLTGSNNANLSGWYGYRMMQIRSRMQAIFAGYPGAPALKTILACQGQSGDSVIDLTNLIENARFQNSSVTALSRAQGNAPIDHCDYVSYALYFGGIYTPSSLDPVTQKYRQPYFANFKAIVDLHAAGNTAAAYDALRDDFLNNMSVATNRFSNWNTLCTTYGKPVKMYEFHWETGYPSATVLGGGTVILYSNTNKSMASNVQFTTMVSSLGLMTNTSTTIGGGDTISSAGLYGYPVYNKANNPITTSTLLSGSAGTDSVKTDFAAGNTITIAGTVITFVASGATGNQLNVTDSIGTLLAKIDAITGTTTPSVVRAPVMDSSYAGTGGKIDLLFKGFYSSAQCGQVISRYLKEMKALSQSEGMSISGVPGSYPYFSFGLTTPSTDTQGRFTNTPNSFWQVMSLANNTKRRIVW